MSEKREMIPQTPGLNPFLPFPTYVADGEPKVFGERVYLYGSYDLFGGGYCSDRYHVFSAPVSDLTDWTDHGVCFEVSDVPWSQAVLYAPDALYRGGLYYLFFCLSDGTEGVAQSTSPTGPFTNARQIALCGEPIRGIDPSVLEDGGHVYYTWGQFSLHMGELADDMCTILPQSVHTDVLSNAPGREGFHEGSSLRKVGERYCMIYASEFTDEYPHNGGRPTKLDYALSSMPYGPYTRCGTVIDNTGCDPVSWNNHGSIVRIGEEWYVFYHASTGNTQFSRRARVERLCVDESAGKITQAVPTTNGFVRELLPEHITSSVHACRFFGGAYVTETPDGYFPAVGLRDGAGFSFSPIRFSQGDYTLSVQYRAAHPARLRVTVGEKSVIEAELPQSAQWTESKIRLTVPACTEPLTCIVYGSADEPLCEINTLCFERGNAHG